ncbi:ABC transporter substrate-binding protein [Acetonema longum]|uniref:Extracellular solute-binding protein family 5 n=1 Tax=Acetonema longum DSM 6540 TaxID=1009370 RepID=F7NFG9_9FIRM|nr:ABC transporter substrate-binding protein [Acetonema longum]EGO65224.1 extracellular solute-binding protein family 5 [Acetonema longum DSM 6540]
MNKGWNVFWMIVLVLPMLVSCGRVEPVQNEKEEVTISVGDLALSQKYDPIAGYGVWFPPLFHSSLVKVNHHNQIESDLAEKYEVSSDGLEYTFYLRKGVKFSDGSPLKASDIIFTFRKAQATPSSADTSMIEKTTVIDDNTVVFRLTRPWSMFPYNVSEIGIVPEKSYDENYIKNPIGSGPWKMVHFEREQQLIIEANEHYYGPKPKLKRVTIIKLDEDAALAAAQSGKLDLLWINAEYGKHKVAGMRLAEIPTISGLVFNLPTTPEYTDEKGFVRGNRVTADPAIRKALNIGIDRKRIIENAFNGFGTVATGFSPKLPWANPEALFSDNRREEANQILAEAGWLDADGDGIREKDGIKAEFVITGRSSDLEVYNLAVAAAEDAKQLGIHIIAKSEAKSEALKNAPRIPTGWIIGRYTPLEFYRYYESNQIGAAGYGNPAGYRNPASDEYAAKALRALSQEEANRNWRLAQWDGKNGVLNDYPYWWIAYSSMVFFVRDGLDLGEQGAPHRTQGAMVLSNLHEWEWK